MRAMSYLCRQLALRGGSHHPTGLKGVAAGIGDLCEALRCEQNVLYEIAVAAAHSEMASARMPRCLSLSPPTEITSTSQPSNSSRSSFSPA